MARKFKYFAISDNASDKYYTKEQLRKDLHTFGNDEEVKVYTLANVEDEQELTSEDLLYIWKNGKIIKSYMKPKKTPKKESLSLKESPRYKDLVKLNDTTWKYKDKVTIGYNEYGKYYFVIEPDDLDWMYSGESLKDLLNGIDNELEDKVDESMKLKESITYTIFYTDANGKSGAIEYSDYNEAQHDLDYMQKGIPFEYQDVYMTSSGEDDEYDDYDDTGYDLDLYQDEEETWYGDDVMEEDLLSEDKDTYFDFKQKLTNAKTIDELQKVWGMIKSSINQLEDKEADKLYSIYKSLKDVLTESLNEDFETYGYIIRDKFTDEIIEENDRFTSKDDAYDKASIRYKTLLDENPGKDYEIEITNETIDTDFDESLKEDYFDDKEFITLPEEDQAQFEKLMNDNGWVLDDETTKRGSKNFYDAWFHKEGDGAQDIHYQFITKDTYTEDEWDELMDNTFDLLDECEKEYNTRIRFSAGLINDGSKYNGRGTIGIDIDAPELVIKGEDKVPAELAGHKIRLKNGKPHGEDSKKVIKDIEDHGFDVSQMGVKKDESLKEGNGENVFEVVDKYKGYDIEKSTMTIEVGGDKGEPFDVFYVVKDGKLASWMCKLGDLDTLEKARAFIDKLESKKGKNIKEDIDDREHYLCFDMDKESTERNIDFEEFETYLKDLANKYNCSVDDEDSETYIWVSGNETNLKKFADAFGLSDDEYSYRKDEGERYAPLYTTAVEVHSGHSEYMTDKDYEKGMKIIERNANKYNMIKKKSWFKTFYFGTKENAEDFVNSCKKELDDYLWIVSNYGETTDRQRQDFKLHPVLAQSLEEARKARDYESEYNITPADKKKIIQWWKEMATFYEDSHSKSYVGDIDDIYITNNVDDIDGWLDAMYDSLVDLSDYIKNPDNHTNLIDIVERARNLLRRGKALYNKYAKYSSFRYGVKESKESKEKLESGDCAYHRGRDEYFYLKEYKTDSNGNKCFELYTYNYGKFNLAHPRFIDENSPFYNQLVLTTKRAIPQWVSKNEPLKESPTRPKRRN